MNRRNRCIIQLMKYSVIKIMKMIKVKKIRTKCNGILISNKKEWRNKRLIRIATWTDCKKYNAQQ